MSLHNYPVYLAPIAEQDYHDIISYLQPRNPNSALLIGNAIAKALTSLSTKPYLGRLTTDERLIHFQYRVLVVRDYLIFYQIRDSTVFVYRIIHGARDLLDLLIDPSG